MPNWTRNHVLFEGDKAQIKEIMDNYTFTEDDPLANCIGSGAALDFRKIVPVPDEIERGNMMVDWCTENWGTKWMPRVFAEAVADSLSFDTAWECPKPIFVRLSEMFPDVKITVTWCDEEPGECGRCIFYQGMVAEFRPRYRGWIKISHDALGSDDEDVLDDDWPW